MTLMYSLFLSDTLETQFQRNARAEQFRWLELNFTS